jgi:hypothetical protein
MAEYATIDQLRSEGVSSDQADDARLLSIIQRNSALIEQWTGRWFYPRELMLRLDGNNADQILIGIPIIAVTELRILEPDYVIVGGGELVDLTSVRIYNRHLTQGLTDPDDRYNPKIQYLSAWSGTRQAPNIFPSGWFPVGRQNIQINGLFGFTEWDDGVTLWTDAVTPVGKVPDIINLVCMMLAVRDLTPLSDVSARTEALLSSTVTEERTRDQSVKYGGGGSKVTSAGAGILANKEIQQMLAPFRRLPGLGAV